MSKKNNENPPTQDSFSFLELDKFLTQEQNIIKERNDKSNNKKKSPFYKKDSEKKQQLRIKPNVNIAREQTSDDKMYIENEDNLKVEESEKEIKKENININKEKNVKKNIVEKKKIDKKIVTINLEKEKSDEKSKNKPKIDNLDNKVKYKGKKPNVDSIEEIINQIKDKDPKAYTPIILPFDKDKNEEKSVKDELIENDKNNNENKLFVFQFPRQIPIKDLENQIKIKEEENVNEEPNYDENGFLISPEFQNSFQELKDNCVIGKLIIMKSGKIKIKMGDIYFDINQGSSTKYVQYSTIITNNNDNQAYILGQPLNKKLIVTPEFD